MTFYFILLMLIVFTFSGLMAKWGFDYNKAKLQAGTPPDNSLGMSELRKMIREAVQEANAPLEERIEQLEADAERRALPPHRPASPRPQPMKPSEEDHA